MMAFAPERKVLDDIKTFVFFTPIAKQHKCNPAEPLDTAQEYLLLKILFNFFSNFSTN